MNAKAGSRAKLQDLFAVFLTKGLLVLCNYANINYKKYQEIDPKSHQYLMDVLTNVWNGTDGHAKQLGRLLLAAHSCKLEQ